MLAGCGGGPRENPRSLSSSKAEKFEVDFFLTDGWREGGTTDGQSDLYYPLVANKNWYFACIRLFSFKLDYGYFNILGDRNIDPRY